VGKKVFFVGTIIQAKNGQKWGKNGYFGAFLGIFEVI
jgi:hypothetical protein